jgi:hypothetical protein
MGMTAVATPGLQLSNGDHVCVFCRGGERDELLLPFLADGLSAGDRCLAVVDTSEPEEVLDALGPGGADAHPADQLTVLASRDVYLTDRGFDMEGMLDFYGAELRGVAEGRSGYDCIRTAGEMSWALRDIPGVGDLLTYEARVNQVLAANPEAAAISLCLYDVDASTPSSSSGCCAPIPRWSWAGPSSTTRSTSSRRSSCSSATDGLP